MKEELSRNSLSGVQYLWKKIGCVDCNLIAYSVDCTLIYSRYRRKTVVERRYWHAFPLKLVITDNGYSEIWMFCEWYITRECPFNPLTTNDTLIQHFSCCFFPFTSIYTIKILFSMSWLWKEIWRIQIDLKFPHHCILKTSTIRKRKSDWQRYIIISYYQK